MDRSLRVPKAVEDTLCSELEKNYPFYFKFSEGQHRNHDVASRLYLEAAKSAYASYERTVHQTQLPVIGIEVEGNNVAITANVITAFLMFALGLAFKSEFKSSSLLGKLLIVFQTEIYVQKNQPFLS